MSNYLIPMLIAMSSSAALASSVCEQKPTSFYTAEVQVSLVENGKPEKVLCVGPVKAPYYDQVNSNNPFCGFSPIAFPCKFKVDGAITYAQVLVGLNAQAESLGDLSHDMKSVTHILEIKRQIFVTKGQLVSSQSYENYEDEKEWVVGNSVLLREGRSPVQLKSKIHIHQF